MSSILSASAPEIRFCFLIDGLDECGGDHRDLVDTTNAWYKFPAVKICVSSRPWNIFRNAYGANSNLSIALHELTALDIDLYISTRLEASGCGILRKAELEELGNIVRRRSEGVFVWVDLAVRNLRRGINEHDTMPVLQERLLGFQSGLQDFLQQTFDRIEPSYRKFTGRLLLAMLSLRGNLALFSIPFFEDSMLDNCSFTVSSIVTIRPPNPPQEMHELLEQAIVCANKWCRDLLQPIKLSEAQDNNLSLPGTALGFGHRTIYEFVSRKATEGTLASMAGHRFEPRLASWYSLVRLSRYATDTDDFIKVVEYALRLASSTEHGISSMMPGFSLADGFSECLLASDIFGQQTMGNSRDRHWTANLLRSGSISLKASDLAPAGCCHTSLVSYVISKGFALADIVGLLVHRQLGSYSDEQKRLLVETSLMPSPTYYTEVHQPCRRSHVDGLLAVRHQWIITKIIKSGVDVNKPTKRAGSNTGYSVWQFYLLWLRAYFHQDPYKDPVLRPGLSEKLPDTGRAVDCFRSFLECGADPSAVISLKDSVQCHSCFLSNPLNEMSATGIVEEMRRAAYARETFDHSKGWSAAWFSPIDELSSLLAQASARTRAASHSTYNG